MIEARADAVSIDPPWRHSAARPSAGALDRVPNLGALNRSTGVFKARAAATIYRDALATGRRNLQAVETVVGAYAVVSGAEEPFGEAPKGSPSTINSCAASVTTPKI